MASCSRIEWWADTRCEGNSVLENERARDLFAKMVSSEGIEMYPQRDSHHDMFGKLKNRLYTRESAAVVVAKRSQHFQFQGNHTMDDLDTVHNLDRCDELTKHQSQLDECIDEVMRKTFQGENYPGDKLTCYAMNNDRDREVEDFLTNESIISKYYTMGAYTAEWFDIHSPYCKECDAPASRGFCHVQKSGGGPQNVDYGVTTPCWREANFENDKFSTSTITCVSTIFTLRRLQ